VVTQNAYDVDVNRVQIGGGHICFRFILTVVMHSAINAL
jgi:hypothetical protein